ncbi:LTA synthase family protein [Marinicella gelatinilytica]|uniref:LTA synthase family protein n=1 Tax=Marinicella gelatinilytica TaxID=2996017 RepID=UPI002260F6B2|nr:LTA synthase family protein [Marinicella gelatinilytica]MCX7545712.1 LTA synthase family protein [Marinicella gelatinilytica]
MVLRIVYFVGLIALLLVVSAETNVLYNKGILLDKPDFYLIIMASLCLLLLLLTWPVVSRNRLSQIISMTLKVVVILSVFLLIFIELAIVDFAGMAFGQEVMYHTSLDAVILGLKEYKYTLLTVLVVVGLLTWFMMTATRLMGHRLQWITFAFSLLGFVLWGHFTVVGRLYKAGMDYYSQSQVKSMSAEELQKFDFLGIQPITTDKNNIQVLSSHHKNLIVVYLESFSRVFTESSRYPNLTPNLNQFKQRYQELYPYISSASFTMDGLITSMCGFIPDMRMGNNTMASQQGTYSALPCYPDVLHKAGFTQEFFGGAKKQFAGKAAFLLSHGFDRVIGWEDFVDLPEYQNVKNHNWWGLNDDDLFERAFIRVSELHKQDRPFHTQILSIGTHLKGFVSPSCEPYSETSHRYINAIHCTDQLLGQFVNRLDEAGILEDTVVYITGDHGVFRSDLSLELFGKQVEDRNLYGVIIDKSPRSSVHVESLYDLAPSVLKLVGVEHNVQFVLGRNYPIKDRMVLARSHFYKNGQLIVQDDNCDTPSSISTQAVNGCTLKSALNAIKGHTQLFSTTDGIALTAESKLIIGFEKSLTGIESIKLDGLDLKRLFKRDGFAVQDKYYGLPGLFYVGINEDIRTAENFVVIRADKNPNQLLWNLKDEFEQGFVLFGAKNSENMGILEHLKKEHGLSCMFDLVCVSQLTGAGFNNGYEQPTVEINMKSLLSGGK